MLSGWRGRIGRSLPEPLTRRMLTAALKSFPIQSPGTIEEVRTHSEQASMRIAEELGIDFGRCAPGMPLTIHSHHWPALRERLKARGLRIQPLHSAHSHAAEAAWSVSILHEHTRAGADLRGAGAVWQLFPGGIESLVDAQDFDGRVDAVYTWVDAEDPNWFASYREHLTASGRPTTDSSVNRARFASRDELRYSLRSLELNLPWIDKIYLVTAGQKPNWLQAEHPKLNLVDHREIFNEPDDCLPTFNSHAIESQLSNIQGLKEHFLYVNDDVFFGRYLHPNSFFGPAGQAKYCMTKGHFSQAQDRQLPVNLAAANNREVILKQFGRTTSRKFQHVAHPQRLSVHRRIHEELDATVAHIARQRFRSKTDLSIPSSLAHQYAALMGLGFPATVNYQYLDTGKNTYYLDMLRLYRNRSLDMFCINEVVSSEDAAERDAQVTQLLNTRFPLRSTLEVSAGSTHHE